MRYGPKGSGKPQVRGASEHRALEMTWATPFKRSRRGQGWVG